MTFVVTEKCINCKHTNCTDACPANCFHEGANFLVIDPHECIDCALCVPVCPVGAIMEDRNLPKDQRPFIRLNAELAALWPSIVESKSPPPDVEEWEGVPGKRTMLER